MDPETGALVPVSRPQTLMKPIASPQEMKEAQDAFRALVEACMEKKDALYIKKDGSMSVEPVDGATRFLKNSMWMKVALGFNLDMETLSSEYLEGEDKNGKFFVYTTRVRVTAPNGRFVIGIGSCSSRDPFFSKAKGYEKTVQPQDIQMKSETVAYNRAISDIVGRREVSAEEVEGKEEGEQKEQQRTTQRGSRGAQSGSKTTDGKEPAKGAARPDDEVPTQADRDFLSIWIDNALDTGLTRENNLALRAKVTQAQTIGELRPIEQMLQLNHPSGRPK
jgi:hypothetical protein